ncbi:hypothetical protein FOB58_004898 [Candida parapsilosis]|uniref:Uncharacterized protein n=2 Tax=Candida parapsilosis TaxID=5480 RepID=G8BHT2_CANPC|nr:uncharacterized protein CPAR2_502320 [Candida parapsilosis]KAF6044613.1 hypothetical protein FOB58_004898 [Candida parapsilosis]KAF6048854.1 hypothetical protein FOB60_004238 [Candida parapsilosis]KAF6060854.1 hypothetical protein FOB61_004863 [Candida parapsilosis]KAI5900879.1 hypothetical protein K4G60_g3 [Candida parapsilosis]KAI5910301.1 hypothetical protein K4G61_g4000 [Candida parapsilosis]
MTDRNTDANPTEYNYLKSRLSPEQFQASIDFYEADSKLTPEDRLKLKQELQSVLVSNNLIGYSAGMIGLITPTIYYKLIKKQTPSKLSFIQKPFLSFFLGLANMMVVSTIVQRKSFNDKITSGELNGPQLDAWKHMEWHNVGAFYYYYLKSSKDPKYKLQDPRTVTVDPKARRIIEPSPDKVSFDPQVYKEKEYHQRDGGANFVNSVGLNDHHNLSHWDKIRLANGFDVTEDEEPKSPQAQPFGGSYNGDVSVHDPQESSTQISAWDRIRGGK